jgi:LysR family nitrogen assimilation transcriptional regulator
MDLKQLEYFVRVAELGSFTRAAGVLNIAQPALSRQVRLLEVELRQNLLLRNGRGVTMTEAGKVLLEHGRGILHQVERAREDLGRVQGSLAGRVAVGMPPSIARMLTVPLTHAFRQRLPNAALSISEGLTISMLEGLQTGRLDIALLYNPTANPDLEIQPVMEEELFLIGPRSSAPPAKASATKLPLIIPSRPNALRMLVETEMARIGCKPRISLEIDGVAAILDLINDGAGYAVLPRHALRVAPKPENFLTTPIQSPRVVSLLVVATAAGRTTTKTQQAMLELIQQVAVDILKPVDARR